jgi:catechol 2,3-dioxygenase-like lactoylglutathione lyase family enzyme
MTSSRQAPGSCNRPERTGVATEPMIDHIDHFVLTVRSLDVTCAFFSACLGMKRVDTPGSPTALHFGTQKINVHETDHTFEPKAAKPTPGSADFCLITTTPLGEVINRLENHGVPIELGPVDRIGALGSMTSVYFRDPDHNLVEVSRYGH